MRLIYFESLRRSLEGHAQGLRAEGTVGGRGPQALCTATGPPGTRAPRHWALELWTTHQAELRLDDSSEATASDCRPESPSDSPGLALTFRQ